MAHEGRAAGAVIVGEARLQAKIFGKRQACEEIVGQADEQTVDVAQPQARIRDRKHGRLGRKLQRSVAGRFAYSISRKARDRGRSAWKGAAHQSLLKPDRTRESASRLPAPRAPSPRSEEHTSELQSLMRTSYAVFC